MAMWRRRLDVYSSLEDTWFFSCCLSPNLSLPRSRALSDVSLDIMCFNFRLLCHLLNELERNHEKSVVHRTRA